MIELLTSIVLLMSSNVQFSSLTASLNYHLFNRTRKFFKQAGVEYDVDMKAMLIIVNNGINSAFMLKFDTYNYVRATKIPKGNIELLFQANSPEWILKKLFDYRFIHYYEVNRIMLVIHSKPKEDEVLELPPSSKINHNKPGLLDGR